MLQIRAKALTDDARTEPIKGSVPLAPQEAEKQEEELSLKDRFTGLQKALSAIDLSGVKEVTGAPTIKIAPVAEIERRAEIAALANKELLKDKGSPCLNALADLLEKKGDKQGAATAAKIAGLMLAWEGLPDLDPKRAEKVGELRKQVWGPLESLALEHGFLIDFRMTKGERLIVPVDAVITAQTVHGKLQACVVGAGGDRENPFAGEGLSASLAVLNIRKLADATPLAVLANEFGHLYLETVLGISPNTKINTAQLAEPQRPALLSKKSETTFGPFKPNSMDEIHELYSDSWSTRADIADVKRLVSAGLKLQTDSFVEGFAGNNGYRLSYSLAAAALFGCVAEAGKDGPLSPKVAEFTAALEELVKLQKAREQLLQLPKEQRKSTDIIANRRARNTAEERTDAAIKAVVEDLPESDQKRIREVIVYYAEHYAAEARKQVEKK